MGTREKAHDSAILRYHQEGYPYSHQKYKTSAPLITKLSVVLNGPWWGETSGMPPLIPSCQKRTKWAWKCVVLHTGIWHFQLVRAASLGTSGGPSCKSFHCMWMSLAETFAQPEDLKWNLKKYLWKVFLELLLVDSHPGKLVPQMRKGKWPSWLCEIKAVWIAEASAEDKLLSIKLQAEYYKEKIGS